MHIAKDYTLYDGGRAPNPRRVAMYLAEKNIEVTIERVDMGQMEHKSESISALNPLMKLPLLILPDGCVLTESIAICRYFEAVFPEPSLFGNGAKQVAIVEMWQRRVELEFLSRVAHAFRHTRSAMREWEVPQIPAWGEANRPKAIWFAELLNQQLAQNDFICGDAFTVADITAIIAMDFSKPARIVYPDELQYLHAWASKIRSRPSYRP